MMRYSRRHYEDVAVLLAGQAHDLWEDPWGEAAGMAAIADTVERFALLFAADNPRFDRGKFLEAADHVETQHGLRYVFVRSSFREGW